MENSSSSLPAKYTQHMIQEEILRRHTKDSPIFQLLRKRLESDRPSIYIPKSEFHFRRTDHDDSVDAMRYAIHAIQIKRQREVEEAFKMSDEYIDSLRSAAPEQFKQEYQGHWPVEVPNAD